MEFTLSPGWTIVDAASGLVLRSEEAEIRIRLDGGTPAVMKKLAAGWRRGDVPALEALRTELERRGAIRPRATSPIAEQERQIEYWRALCDDPVDAVSRVRSSTVAVIGVGGIGAMAVQHLVGAGVASFRLLDADTVEKSNLNRQFIYEQSTVGVQKVDAARDYIAARIPDAEVRVFVGAWDSSSSAQRTFAFEGVDMVVAGIDHPSVASSLDVLDAAWSADVPAIFATVGLHRSLVSPVFSPQRSPRSPLHVLQRPRRQPIGTTFRASHGPANTIPAAIAADQILHHLAGIDRLVDYDRPLIIRRGRSGTLEMSRVTVVKL